MITKKCSKCGSVQDISAFYKINGNSDGHSGKCKICTRKTVDEREKRLRLNPEWVEKEKIRAREKYHRLGYKDIHKPTPEMKKSQIKNYKERFPEKIKAHSILGKKVKPLIIGNQLHHWSYNKEHYLDVIELAELEHSKLHRHIIYDQERMMYRRIDTNELLDTKEKHISYYDSIKNNI